MTDQLEAARDLSNQLEQRRWTGGVRIVVSGSMRAPFIDKRITLEPGWRADVFFENKRKAAFVLVAESSQQLFRDLAGLCEGSILP